MTGSLRSWGPWLLAVGGGVLGVLALTGPAMAYTSGSDDASVGVVTSGTALLSVPVSIDVNGLRVRSQPGLDGPIEGLLYTPDLVRIVSEGPVVDGISWELVRLSGRSAGGLPSGWQGWVATGFVAEPMCQPGNPWVPWACLAELPDTGPDSQAGVPVDGGSGYGVRE